MQPLLKPFLSTSWPQLQGHSLSSSNYPYSFLALPDILLHPCFLSSLPSLPPFLFFFLSLLFSAQTSTKLQTLMERGIPQQSNKIVILLTSLVTLYFLSFPNGEEFGHHLSFIHHLFSVSKNPPPGQNEGSGTKEALTSC